MNKSFIIILILSSVQLFSQQYFEPEDNEFITINEKTNNINELFSKYQTYINSNALFRCIIQTSFQKDVVIELLIKNDSSYILCTYINMSSDLDWVNEDEISTKKNEQNIVIKNKISNDLSFQIKETIFDKLMLLQYSESPYTRRDGVWYHIMINNGIKGIRYGKTWSPQTNSIVSNIAELINTLERYCLAKATEEEIADQILLIK